MAPGRCRAGLAQNASQSRASSGRQLRAQRFVPALQQRVQLAAQDVARQRFRQLVAARHVAEQRPAARALRATGCPRLRSRTVARAATPGRRRRAARACGLRGWPPPAAPTARWSLRADPRWPRRCRSAHSSVDVKSGKSSSYSVTRPRPGRWPAWKLPLAPGARLHESLGLALELLQRKARHDQVYGAAVCDLRGLAGPHRNQRDSPTIEPWIASAPPSTALGFADPVDPRLRRTAPPPPSRRRGHRHQRRAHRQIAGLHGRRPAHPGPGLGPESRRHQSPVDDARPADQARQRRPGPPAHRLRRSAASRQSATPRRLDTYVDETCSQYDEVWAAAGTPNSVFAIDPPDLVRITNGQVADIT